MTEITGLSTTDSSNTEVTGESIDGAIANMGRMDNTLQAILGLLARSIRTNVLRFLDNADDTKRVALDLSGITTATTRTWTAPNKSGTLAMTSDIGASTVPFNLALAASVAGNALTISIKGHDGNDPSATNVVTIPFRSATASSGDVDVLSITAATSFVVSSGSTLGTINATQATLVIVGFNDAGTFRLGIINPVSGNSTLDGIASSTAEGGAGAADSAGVFYTGTAVASKAYTVLGYLTITEATAGSWATSPSLVSVNSDAQTDIARVAANLPVFSIRAWVDFSGSTGTVRASGNISSIVKNGTGDYTLNFSTAMPDANYVMSGMATAANTGNAQTVINYVVSTPGAAPLLKTTTQCRFVVANASGGGPADFATVGVMVVR